MKRVFIILNSIICCQLWASTPIIEGLYVWNPSQNWWRINPDTLGHRRKEPNQKVWDSLYVYSDNHYIMKSSRFYDVGGKTVKSILEGVWSNRGEYISLVPFGVNYSCVPNVTTDSSIIVNLFEIVPVTRDTIPIKRGLLYVYSEDGVLTKYYTDSIGYVEINYSSDILVVFIDGGFNPIIPFPQMGSQYNIVISESYAIPNVSAKFFKILDENLWSCFVYNDSIQLNIQYKRFVEKTDKKGKLCK